MRTFARLTLTAFALMVVAGCGAPTPHEKKSGSDATDRDDEETVFDDMIQTQDRARAVEDLTLGRKSDLDEALRKAEGDEATDEP
jgi:hypothetical protein